MPEIRIRRATSDEVALSLERAADTFEGSKLRRQSPDGTWGGTGSHCSVAVWDGEVASSLFALESAVYWPPAADRARATADVLVDGGRPGRRLAAPTRQDGALEVRRLLGVVSLVTPPEYQGRGLAGALLEWLQVLAVEREFVACGLFSEIGPEFYRRRGFASLSFGFLRGPLPSPAPGGDGPAVGRAFRTEDLPSVVRAYEATASRWPLAVARDADYWRPHLATLPLREDLVSAGNTGRDFVVTGDEVHGYVRSRSDGDIFTVLEVAWVSGAEAEVAALLESELRRAADEGCVRAQLHLPPGFPPPGGTAWKEVRVTTFMLRPAGGALDELDGYQAYVFRPDHF